MEKLRLSPYKTDKQPKASKDAISAKMFALRDPEGLADAYVRLLRENESLKAELEQLRTAQ